MVGGVGVAAIRAGAAEKGTTHPQASSTARSDTQLRLKHTWRSFKAAVGDGQMMEQEVGGKEGDFNGKGGDRLQG